MVGRTVRGSHLNRLAVNASGSMVVCVSVFAKVQSGFLESEKVLRREVLFGWR